MDAATQPKLRFNHSIGGEIPNPFVIFFCQALLLAPLFIYDFFTLKHINRISWRGGALYCYTTYHNNVFELTDLTTL
jgi:hypothetical protein